MKKITLSLSMLALACATLVGCSKTDCECEIINPDTTNGETIDFDLIDYEGNCSDVTRKDLPEKWQRVMHDNSIIHCEKD